MNPRRCLLALASTVALLPAQEQGPFRFAPADSLAVVRIAAPAKWKQQFATTQVVKLFASDKLAPMIGGLSQGIDQGLAALRQSGAFDADLLEKLLTDYKGDIVIAASLDVDGLMQALGSGEMPTFGVSITLTADGAYDLDKLAAEMQKRIEKEGHRTLHDLQVGDHRLRCTKDDDESNLSVPAMIDGQLVMLASNDIEKFATKVLGKAPRFAGNGSDGTMFVHVELAPLMKAIGEAAAASAKAPFDVEALLDAMGLGCLGAANASLGATGKHLTFDSTVQFLEKERGLFGLLGKGGGSPKLLRLVPPDAETWSVSPVDFGALHTMVGNIWSAVGDTAPMTWEQAQQKVTEELKVRLKEDLLDNLGGEVLFVQDIESTLAGAAAEDEDDPLASLNGTCVGIALRDGKAFGDAIEKMLRARGLHAGRKSEDYAATKVHRLRLAGVLDLEYAITDDLMLLGVGSSPASQKALRSVLDARANPAAAGELPAAIKEATAGLAAGWTGISVLRVDGMMRGFADGFVRGFAGSAGAEVPPEMEQALEALKAVGSELGRFGLKTMVTTSRMDATSLRSTLRW